MSRNWQANFLAICGITCFLVQFPANIAYDYDHTHTNSTYLTNRTSKFIGWWGIGVVRFENKYCQTPDGLDGTCYTRRQCREIDGTYSGLCAGKIGRCCTIQRGCGSSSSDNNTYFVNRNYPMPVTGSTVCTYAIKKCHPEICQVRIDFLSFNLAHPNAIGQCIFDSMKITGAGHVVRPICGDNSGQHMYLSFRGNNDITITIGTTGSNDLSRSWYFKVAQIGCDSPNRAPAGCLQYYTDVSATVTSFNYGRTRSGSNIAPNDPGTRQIANQEYGICVRAAPGYCTIKWEATSSGSFAVSGNSSAMEAVTDCTGDYVIIPNGINEDGKKIDRYCGSAFGTVTSSSKPFVLYYTTDSTEELGETGNLGFSLDYTQQRCNPLTIY